MPDYQALAEFRYRLRSFLRASEQRVTAAGLEPQQHQLLLAIKGMPSDDQPTISRLAERLQLRHHSVVGLIDRLAAHGLVERERDAPDNRRVLVQLTPAGESALQALSEFHEKELSELAPALIKALQGIVSARANQVP